MIEQSLRQLRHQLQACTDFSQTILVSDTELRMFRAKANAHTAEQEATKHKISAEESARKANKALAIVENEANQARTKATMEALAIEQARIKAEKAVEAARIANFQKILTETMRKAVQEDIDKTGKIVSQFKHSTSTTAGVTTSLSEAMSRISVKPITEVEVKVAPEPTTREEAIAAIQEISNKTGKHIATLGFHLSPLEEVLRVKKELEDRQNLPVCVREAKVIDLDRQNLPVSDKKAKYGSVQWLAPKQQSQNSVSNNDKAPRRSFY